jgi:hypothetical protein
MFETIAITGFVRFVVIAGGTNLLEDYKVPDFATVLIGARTGPNSELQKRAFRESGCALLASSRAIAARPR